MWNKKAGKADPKSGLHADPIVSSWGSILLEVSEDSCTMHFRIVCLMIRRGRSRIHWIVFPTGQGLTHNSLIFVAKCIRMAEWKPGSRE